MDWEEFSDSFMYVHFTLPQAFPLHNVKFPNTTVVMNYLIFTHKYAAICALKNQANILIQPGKTKTL